MLRQALHSQSFPVENWAAMQIVSIVKELFLSGDIADCSQAIRVWLHVIHSAIPASMSKPTCWDGSTQALTQCDAIHDEPRIAVRETAFVSTLCKRT